MICTRLKLCVQAELKGNVLSKCDNQRNHCIQSSDSRTYIKCEENGKKYILENAQKSLVISYRMDNGIIVNDGKVQEGINKCDYLLVVDVPDRTAILIELKGAAVPKALDQLQASLTQYQSFFKDFSHVYGRAIVASSTPNLKASPEYVHLSKMLKRDFNGNIKIVERQFSEKVEDLGKG